MIMERVDFTDSRFDLCRNFIRVSNRGKGQNIRVRVNESNIKKFLNNKTVSKIPNETNKFRHFSVYEPYILTAVKTVESSVKEFNTWYGFGYGDWQGSNRKNEMLSFEERLKNIKAFYDILEDINFDNESFNYIARIQIGKENKLKIIINNNGIKYYSDLEKFIKFLNIIGYDCQKGVCYNENLLIFENIDITKINESKSIWEFI